MVEKLCLNEISSYPLREMFNSFFEKKDLALYKEQITEFRDF